MNTASTPSQEVVTDAQARKLVEQLTPGLVDALVESKIPRVPFQELIMREKNLRVRSRFVQFVRDIIAEIVVYVVIHCNYGEKNAIAKAIEDNKFNAKYLDLSPNKIPLMGEGKADHEVGEAHFNKRLTTREVLQKVEEHGGKFATPLAALRYAVKLPDRQCQYPLVVIFKIDGWLWHLFKIDGWLWHLMLDGDATVRRLYVRRDNGVDRWYNDDRFLVVRK